MKLLIIIDARCKPEDWRFLIWKKEAKKKSVTGVPIFRK